jgi:phosphopentomutase
MTLQLRNFNVLEYLKRETRNEVSKCITQFNRIIAQRFNDRGHRTYWRKVGRKSFNISACSATVPL